jgi:hypothetical protein
MELDMAYAYDTEAHIDFDRGVIFSWLRDQAGKGSPVRVEASREYIADHWRVDWQDPKSVEAEFMRRRDEYVAAAADLPEPGDRDYRVFPIYRH